MRNLCADWLGCRSEFRMSSTAGGTRPGPIYSSFCGIWPNADSGRFRFRARTLRGVRAIQSVMLNVPNSEKCPLSNPSRKWHSPGPSVLDGVPVAARKIPGVAFFEIIHFGLAVRRDDGGAAASGEHIGPLGGQGVPVQFANRARVQPHGDARDGLRDGQLFDGGLFGGAAWANPAFLALDIVFESLQLVGLGLFGRRGLHLLGNRPRWRPGQVKRARWHQTRIGDRYRLRGRYLALRAWAFSFSDNAIKTERCSVSRTSKQNYPGDRRHPASRRSSISAPTLQIPAERSGRNLGNREVRVLAREFFSNYKSSD